MFGKEQQANDFLVALKLRLAEYGLSLNEDKTAIINFTKGQENIFNFLGFTFFWNKKKGWNKINLVIKTEQDRLAKKTQSFTDWIKSCRSMINIKEIWSITAAKLRGHYNYYGYFCNRGKLHVLL
jgi:RNA-directed DNA polymerase